MQSLKQQQDTEAKISLIQMGIRPYNDVVFSAPGFNGDYIVTAIDGVAQSCNCKWTQEGGWTRQGGHLCSHAIAVERWVAEEARAAASSEVEEDDETLSADEVAELVALNTGPRAGVFASVDEMVASIHEQAVEVVKVADSRLTVAEEHVAIRRGYSTRTVGVTRDPVRGIILR